MSKGCLAFMLAFFGFTAPVVADSWDDESGNGWGQGLHAPASYYEVQPGKYEWEAGGCKYEYKSDGGGFKEEYKCDRGGPYVNVLPPTQFVPPGYVSDGLQPARFLLGPQIAAGDGRYCREYQRQVWVAGALREAYGMACHQPDGAWQIVE